MLSIGHALCALVVWQTAPAEPVAVAEAYLAAYEAQDFDALRTLYAENAVFIDPTSADVQPITPPISWRGRETIIEGLRSWGVARMDYTLDRSFHASGQVVFDGTSDVVYQTPNGELTYRFPIITILTVEDGQVTEHRDYTDYAGMRELPASGTGETE
jgi:ketosteroid isomerase-like protein